MKKVIKTIVLLALLIFSFGLMGCSNDPIKSNESNEEKKEITVGVASFSLDAAEAMKDSFEQKGYKLNIKMFDDTITPNIALNEGTIDATYHQHTAYLEAFNKDRGTNLRLVEPLYFSRIGIYSDKYKSIEELPNGSKIGVYNDASNQNRNLLILNDLGLIKLADKEGPYSLLDIEENPKDFEFVEMDMLYLANSLNDCDASFVGAYMYLQSGGDPSTALYFEPYNEPFSVGLVTREEDKDKQWVKDFIEAAKTPESISNFDEVYKNSYELLK